MLGYWDANMGHRALLSAEAIELRDLHKMGRHSSDWFGLISDTLRMRSTDDSDVVVVSDGDNEEGPTLGDFRRGTGCLKLVDAALGCFGGGAYVFPCDGD